MGWFERCEPSRRLPAAVSLDRYGAATWTRREPPSRDPGLGGRAEGAPQDYKRPSSERRWKARTRVEQSLKMQVWSWHATSAPGSTPATPLPPGWSPA